MKSAQSNVLPIFIIGVFFFISSCAQSPIYPTPQINPVIQPTFKATETITPKAEPTPTPTQLSKPETIDLIPQPVFDRSNTLVFCLTQLGINNINSLMTSCNNGKLIFTAAEDIGKHSKYLLISQSITLTQSFTLEVDAVSSSYQNGKIDQNEYGFRLPADQNHGYTLRFKGQYFKLDQYLIQDGELHTAQSWNWNYAPTINTSGNSNHFKLACEKRYCDLSINNLLAGRFHFQQQFSVSEIGIYTRVDTGATFGKVELENMRVYQIKDESNESAVYSIQDDLRSDKGTFPKVSGAFNSYKSDGFHFCPVMLYGYYGIKTGPALQDVSVSATVKINPQYSSSTLYAGLVCRSSTEGMYFAVIRDSGTYSIFRDTPNRPFTLLAQKRSSAIHGNGAENKLQLDCVGNKISFTINGQLVETLQDSQFNLISGRVGFFTKASKTPDEDAIVFSDFSVKEVR